MKAFRFTLEAVRTLRLRQENDALEQYARTLAVRQRAINALEAVREKINAHWAEMRRRLAAGGAASEARRLQEYQNVLETRQQECAAGLRAAERGVNLASQAMLLARQQREVVDAYRDKQVTRHQRLENREEQKISDEFAARRSTSLQFATPTHA